MVWIFYFNGSGNLIFFNDNFLKLLVKCFLGFQEVALSLASDFSFFEVWVADLEDGLVLLSVDHVLRLVLFLNRWENFDSFLGFCFEVSGGLNDLWGNFLILLGGDVLLVDCVRLDLVEGAHWVETWNSEALGHLDLIGIGGACASLVGVSRFGVRLGWDHGTDFTG